jgi:selenocysteine-specific elongation factor
VVVTGTLISGMVAKEQEVEVYPSGRRLRVRGVEVHGAKAERAVAGQRTALNLADIEVSELSRGDALSEPGRFRAMNQVECRLDLLRSAKPLKHRAPVHFHSGTAEIEAQVRLLDAGGAVQPGASAWIRIVLRDPALLLPGDRFIIRSFSPVTTIGGGVVVDTGVVAARAVGGPAGLLSRLAVLAASDAVARVALLVRESKFGVSLRELVARTGMLESAIADAAARAPVVALAQPQPWYVDRAWFEAACEHLAETVREFHHTNPLAPGIAKEDLRARELPGAPAFLLDELLARGGPVVEGSLVRMPAHQVALKDDEQHARSAIERAFEHAGLATPALAETLEKSGVEPARARSLLAILLREKKLVRIGEDLVFHRSAIEALRAMLATRRPARFTVGDFKTWTGVSRKYAIPLLEYLDRERITRREGDARVIL